MVISERDMGKILQANASFHEEVHEIRGGREWRRFHERLVTCESNQGIHFENSLELCCGNGFLYRTFNSESTPLNSMSCHCDLSKGQLDYFKNEDREARLIQTNVLSLPFPEECFELVYGNSFIHHIPNVPGLFSEACRILRPDGKFIVFHEPTPTARFFESFPISLYKQIDHRSLTDIWLIDPEKIEELLQKAGFRTVNILPSGISFSLIFNPLVILLNKFRLPVKHSAIARLKHFSHSLDGLLPAGIKKRYAPSVAIVAKK